jgi:hypothetical protein
MRWGWIVGIDGNCIHSSFPFSDWREGGDLTASPRKTRPSGPSLNVLALALQLFGYEKNEIIEREESLLAWV